MLMDPRIRNHALHIRCRGLVQGVGFRPFVWRLATELNLQGYVRNDEERRRVELDAWALFAVDEVVNRLELRPV